MPLIFIPASLVFLSLLAAAAEADEPSRFVGAPSCLPCHQEIFETYVQTAHFNTSQPANDRSIKGSFSYGHNVLRTRDPNVYFKMEKRHDGFYQTAYRSAVSSVGSRSERFDVIQTTGKAARVWCYHPALPDHQEAQRRLDGYRLQA